MGGGVGGYAMKAASLSPSSFCHTLFLFTSIKIYNIDEVIVESSGSSVLLLQSAMLFLTNAANVMRIPMLYIPVKNISITY